MAKFCLFLALSLLLPTVTTGEGCQRIDGAWMNQHGSVMSLSHTVEHKLLGNYRTAISQEGSTEGAIIGVAPYSAPGATFGFLVMWRGGNSTTAWTAQCHMCRGRAVLMTSWLLRAKQNTCLDRWKAVQIGQDTFRRVTVSPTARPNTSKGTMKEHLKGNVFNQTKHKSVSHRYSREVIPIRKHCHLAGDWFSSYGSKFHAVEGGLGLLHGEYWTDREVLAGRLSGTHSVITGLYNDVVHGNHTLGFLVSWDGGKSVTAWVGQCHVCRDNQTAAAVEVLETTWFHRVKVASCRDNWKTTLYGQTSYTRQAQPPTNLDGRDGFGDYGDPVESAAGATYRATSTLLLVATALALMTMQ